MHTVLIIAYYFPPMGLSGVQRTLKFVKYLPENGWRPIVLTAGETPYYAMDDSLMNEIRPLIESGKVRIVRTAESGVPAAKYARKEGNILKLPSASYQRIRSKVIQTVLQPDSRIRWRKPAIAAASKLFSEERIDAIFSTAPPYTDFLIGKELSELHHVPFLMDYRDAWVGNPVLNFYATPFHKAYAANLERGCLRRSGAITVVNRKMKEVLIDRYPFLSHEDVTIIPHGYDPEDLELAGELTDRSNGVSSVAELQNDGKFRLTYSGAFYVGRSPEPLFAAVQRAMQSEPRLRKDLELAFAGVLQKEFQSAAQVLGLSDSIRSFGYLPHHESIALLLNSSVIWMTMSDDLSAPGKLYEYMGTGKPILGLVQPESQAERLLQEYGASVTAPPNDVAAICEAILGLYRQWRVSSLPRNVNLPFVRNYDRRLLTKTLSRQLGLMLGPEPVR